MKITEIIEEVGKELNLVDLKNGINSCPAATRDEIFRNILYTIERISEQYVPLCGEISYNVTNFKINYSNIKPQTPGGKLLSITSIVDSAGNRVDYALMDSYVKVYTLGPVTVNFTYSLSSSASMSGELSLPPTITMRAVTFGACYEYLLSSGKIDEANIYDKKFKDSIMSGANSRKSRYIKPRRWY